MKANQAEKNTLSDSIDKLTEGLDDVIELFNNLEEEKPLIQFSPDVEEKVIKAMKIYGEENVSLKINTIVGEMLEWLPLEQDQEANEELEL